MSPANSANDLPDRWIELALPRALAFAQSLVRDLQTAEDLVHDCVFRLWQRRDQYDLSKDGLRLLLKSISNAAIDRARRRQPMLTDDGTVEVIASDDCDTVFRQLLMKEMEMQLETALAQLPIKQRSALQLSSLGFSLRDIADALSVSETNAGVLIYRARQAMADLLRPYLEQE